MHDSTPAVTLVDGIPRVSSLDIAERFGKPHKDVLSVIRRIIEEIDPYFRERNFSPTFVDIPGPNGAVRKSPAFSLTRDAFSLVAMGFTGKEALAWKVKYIDAFNAMEAKLLEQAALPSASPAIEAAQPALPVSTVPAHLSIAFAGTTLYLCSHEGEPHVPLRPVVDGMGIDWKTQIKKIAKSPEWGCVMLPLALYSNRTEDQLCIPLRSLDQYLAGITPQKVKSGMRRRVSTFLRSCRKKLEAAWKAAHAPHRGDAKDITLPLKRLIEAWGEISGLSQKTLEAQVLAVFVAPSIAALDEEQASNALRWVQCRIDALAARPQQAALPEAPQAPALPPAIPKLDPADELDAELRKEAESLNDAQRAYASRMHVKVMKLVDWNACGLEWFDLASDVIFNMLCQRNCGTGAATRRSLPVAFATALNKLLVERRQLRVAALHDVRGAA